MTIIDDNTDFIPEEDVVCEDEKPTLPSLVERGVNIKREVNILKDDLTGVAETAKELFGVKKRDFNALVKYSFEASITADIEELQAIQNKLQNLVDGNSDPSQGDLFDQEDTE